jgi:hypothetical protein
MCRGRRARILLHLHIQLKGYVWGEAGAHSTTPTYTVKRDGPARERVCVCLLLQYLIQSCARGGRRIVEDMCYEIRRAEACVD